MLRIKITTQKKYFQQVTLGLVILAVACIGVYALINSHAAATTYASSEAESGLRGGAATIQTDNNASGRQYVQFGDASSGGTDPVPTGVPGSWTLKFDDEFSGTSLDTTKWSTGWFGSGITAPVNSEELECYDPAQVGVSGGYLNLTAISKQEDCGANRPYASGIITSMGKYDYQYGFIEARIYLPGTAGTIDNWPTFWTNGEGTWPATGEQDVLEGLGGQACYHFHDPSGGPGGCAPGDYTGWHVYGANWQAGKVTFYYDGAQVGQITSGITDSPMYIILNLALDNSNGGPIAVPSTMQVDYVRVWQ